MLELPLRPQQMELQEQQILVAVVEPEHTHNFVEQMVVQVLLLLGINFNS